MPRAASPRMRSGKAVCGAQADHVGDARGVESWVGVGTCLAGARPNPPNSSNSRFPDALAQLLARQPSISQPSISYCCRPAGALLLPPPRCRSLTAVELWPAALFLARRCGRRQALRHSAVSLQLFIRRHFLAAHGTCAVGKFSDSLDFLWSSYFTTLKM